MFGLDATGRMDQITTSTNGAERTKETYQFDDDSDAPTAISTYTDATADQAAKTTLTRYIVLGGLGMVASIGPQGAEYQLSNLHGDIVATTDGTGTVASYTEFDEFGKPLGDGIGRYGYLGVSQRQAGLVGGVDLMGARLFDPSTGQFLSVDSVPNGNATRYDYPCDPVNSFDVTGRSLGGVLKKAVHAVGHALKQPLETIGAYVAQSGVGWLISHVIGGMACEGIGTTVCAAAVSGIAAFCLTLIVRVLFQHHTIASSMHPAEVDGALAFTGSLGEDVPLHELAALAKDLKNIASKIANWLIEDHHSLTAKAAINGVNVIVDDLYGLSS